MSNILFSPEQQAVIDAALAGRNIFLTGVAGTGKTAVVRGIIQQLKAKNLEVAVTSSTGITALDLDGGKTLHSFAGIGYGDLTKDEVTQKAKKTKWLQAIWRNTDVLLVDEISMVQPLYLEKVDIVAKISRRNPHAAFGGMQIIFVGDFGQLPYVVKGQQDNTQVFLFETELWKSLDLDTFLLTKVHRQQSDPEFVELLQRVRVGQITPEDEQRLKAKVHDPLKDMKARGILPTRLFSLNRDVDSLNEAELKKLPGNAIKYQMTSGMVGGEGIDPDTVRKKRLFLTKNCNASAELELKLGAQVILTVNYAPDARLMNGSRGVVVGFDEKTKEPVVQFLLQKAYIRSWDWKQFFDKSEKQYVFISQVPLKLAYALSVHKSQGQTLDCVEIALDRTFFSENQAYVALSRVRSFSALSLSNFDPRCIKSNQRVCDFYTKLQQKQNKPPSEDKKED
jgi:ATP-dependent DNA helicase PIF1